MASLALILRKTIAVVGYVLSFLLILQPSLAETDTCTQGGPDGFAAAVIATASLSFLSLPSILQAVSLRSKIHLLGLLHLVTVIVFSYKVAPVLLHTNLGGVHICGSDFGFASYPEEFLYAPVLIGALLAILVSSALGILQWTKSRDRT